MTFLLCTICCLLSVGKDKRKICDASFSLCPSFLRPVTHIHTLPQDTYTHIHIFSVATFSKDRSKNSVAPCINVTTNIEGKGHKIKVKLGELLDPLHFLASSFINLFKFTTCMNYSHLYSANKKIIWIICSSIYLEVWLIRLMHVTTEFKQKLLF